MLQGTAVELLRSMIEEADELPQAQLDALLIRLLPSHRAESPAGHALVATLLQRTETTVGRTASGVQAAVKADGQRDGGSCAGWSSVRSWQPWRLW